METNQSDPTWNAFACLRIEDVGHRRVEAAGGHSLRYYNPRRHDRARVVRAPRCELDVGQLALEIPLLLPDLVERDLIEGGEVPCVLLVLRDQWARKSSKRCQPDVAKLGERRQL